MTVLIPKLYEGETWPSRGKIVVGNLRWIKVNHSLGTTRRERKSSSATPVTTAPLQVISF